MCGYRGNLLLTAAICCGLRVVQFCQISTLDPQTRMNASSQQTTRMNAATAGTVELRIPKLRKGSFFPALLEPRRLAEKALAALVRMRSGIFQSSVPIYRSVM
jgi:hypothetical protein